VVHIADISHSPYSLLSLHGQSKFSIVWFLCLKTYIKLLTQKNVQFCGT